MTLPDRLALIAEGFSAVDSWYVDGALAELEQDDSLRERFRLTMEALDAAPTEPELRQALEAHLGVVAECVVRHGRKEGLCEHVPWDLVAWYLENPEARCGRCHVEAKKEDEAREARAAKVEGTRARLRKKLA